MSHRFPAAAPLLVACLALCAAPCRGGPADASSVRAGDPGLAARADAYLQPYLALDVFQGVVLIARGDRVLLEKGYGDANLELGVRNTPDRVFRIASLTKPLT
jgi:CubicO group peptidase (beta-lactamase class C family)